MVQEAGFEPANRYGLGPHPSAFDQAWATPAVARTDSLAYINTSEDVNATTLARAFSRGRRHSLVVVEQ